MRKLIAAMRLSLDGRSEGPDGYADWVDAWAEDYGITERIDACLLGGRMYPGYEQYWTAIRQAPEQPLPMTGRLPHPAELRWSEFAQRTPHYVLSTTLQGVNWPQTRVIRHADAVRDLKAQTGKDIYLMGGAALVGSMLDAGLVDELHCGPSCHGRRLPSFTMTVREARHVPFTSAGACRGAEARHSDHGADLHRGGAGIGHGHERAAAERLP